MAMWSPVDKVPHLLHVSSFTYWLDILIMDATAQRLRVSAASKDSNLGTEGNRSKKNCL